MSEVPLNILVGTHEGNVCHKKASRARDKGGMKTCQQSTWQCVQQGRGTGVSATREGGDVSAISNIMRTTRLVVGNAYRGMQMSRNLNYQI